MIAQGLFHSRPPRLLWPWDSPGKKKYGSGLPCPPPWDSPDPETEPASFMSPTLAVRFFTTRATREAGGLRPVRGLSLFFRIIYQFFKELLYCYP